MVFPQNEPVGHQLWSCQGEIQISVHWFTVSSKRSKNKGEEGVILVKFYQIQYPEKERIAEQDCWDISWVERGSFAILENLVIPRGFGSKSEPFGAQGFPPPVLKSAQGFPNWESIFDYTAQRFIFGLTSHRKVHVFSSAKNNIYFINFGRELSKSKSINLSEIFEIA